jgi:hypothetical protein
MTYDPIDTNEGDDTADGNVTLADVDSDVLTTTSVSATDIGADTVDASTEVTTADLVVGNALNGAVLSSASDGQALAADGTGNLRFDTPVVGISEGAAIAFDLVFE